MGLHRFKPIPSGRMGVLWTLSTIKNAAVVEYGCMGHMLYSGVTLKRSGVSEGCKLYSTHINETDISLGDTKRLEKVIANIVQTECPKALFLTPSSVPEVIGVDMDAICEELQKQYSSTRLLSFGCGGFDRTQHQGVQQALSLLVKSLPKDSKKHWFLHSISLAPALTCFVFKQMRKKSFGLSRVHSVWSHFVSYQPMHPWKISNAWGVHI